MIRSFLESGYMKVMALTGGAAILIGSTVIAGLISDSHILASFSTGYIHMAPATAIATIIFGIIFLTGAYQTKNRFRKIITTMVTGTVTVYGLLKFLSFFIPVDLVLDDLFFPVSELTGKFPVNHMSPYSGLLFLMTGISVLLNLLFKEKFKVYNLITSIGLIVAFAGFVALLGYFFGTPFMYSGSIIPLALPTAFAFLFLGIGQTVMAGSRGFFIRQFTGSSAQARVLRLILPLVLAGILIEAFLDLKLTGFLPVNPALQSALLTLLLLVLTIVLVIRLTKTIFRSSDRAETERRKSEAELRKFKLAIDKSSEAIFITDLEGVIQYVNPKFEIIYGYGKEEALGKTPRILKSGILDQEIYIRFWKTLLAGEAVTGEIINKTRDGRLITIEGSNNPIVDTNGRMIGFMGIHRDVTESRAAALALQKSEEQYRNLVTGITNGVYRSTHDGKFIEVNPAMVKMFGYDSREEMFAIDIKKEMYFSESDREEGVNEEKLMGATIFRMRKKDGTEIWVEDHGSYIRDEKGNILYHEGIIRDVTDRRKAEIRLKKYSEELAESNATKDKFFSIIAHDLKGPFNSIMGLTNIFLDNIEEYDREEIEKLLRTIANSSKHALGLLENLLTWASSQTGQIRYTPEKIDLKALVGDCIELLKGQAEKKNIEIVPPPEAEKQVVADRNMLGTVIRNIISNAVKFTSPGGKIFILVEIRDGHCNILVRDTGVGIRREDIPKLFRIDSKYSTWGTEDEKGTGLGLILCKDLMEKQGGAMGIESQQNIGTTVTIKLPYG